MIVYLVGMPGSGKSTVGRLLAERTGAPRCSIDDVRWAYYEAAGYERSRAQQIAASEAGAMGELLYTRPFEVYAIERALAERTPAIVDFGASNSVFDEEPLLARVERALAPLPHVILLMPSPDPEESGSILRARLTARPTSRAAAIATCTTTIDTAAPSGPAMATSMVAHSA